MTTELTTWKYQQQKYIYDIYIQKRQIEIIDRCAINWNCKQMKTDIEDSNTIFFHPTLCKRELLIVPLHLSLSGNDGQ